MDQARAVRFLQRRRGRRGTRAKHRQAAELEGPAPGNGRRGGPRHRWQIGERALARRRRPVLAAPQTHAMHFVDINGDGLKDLVTGRRWWAHGPKGDAGPNDPAYIYWFE